MLCLVDYRNLVGRSKVMRSTCLHEGVEYDASFRDCCISIISTARSSLVVFCLDGSPNYRLSIHPEYKGTRKKEEPDPDALPVYPTHLLIQDMRVASQTFNTPVWFACSPHREADDVIASIIKQVQEETLEDLLQDERLVYWAGVGVWKKYYFGGHSDICIMSSDSDLQQLIKVTNLQRVGTVSKMSLVDTRYEVSDTYKKRDVNTPVELLAYKLLEGDAGDNIPRSRILPPRKCGNMFWKVLNSEEKLLEFVNNPDMYPDLRVMVDVKRLRLNAHLIMLDERAYPLATPYFWRII